MLTEVRCFLALPLVLGFLLTLGCSRGPKLAEVEGTVSFEGQPLANVQVQFLPDARKGTFGPISVGITDEEGFYSLECTNGQLGAVVGNHGVILRDLSAEKPYGKRNKDKDAEEEPEGLPVRIPPLYTDEAKNPFHPEIKPGKQRIDLKLTSPSS